MRTAVQLEGVTQVYVTRHAASLAVENIHFKVDEGEFVSLIGPSGCGKTTILSIIAGLIRPSTGKVMLQDHEVNEPNSKVGYMLQQDYLFPWRTILQNACFGLELRNELNERNLKYVVHLLEEMGLDGASHKFPHQLSGGMRQRVALVRMLATSPEILLLDEPFSALDYQTKLQLEDLVVDTLKSRNKTAILVTHDISEAIAMSDRIIILDRNPGKVVKEIQIPQHIRITPPLRAREQYGFHEIFHDIWRELEFTEVKG